MAVLSAGAWTAAALVVILFQIAAMAFIARPNVIRGTRMAFLGSGGHTGEMLTMIRPLNPRLWMYVFSEGDALSAQRASQLIEARKDHKVWLESIPRARRVGQSWTSSVFTSLVTLRACLTLINRTRPEYLLCNGPGTCVMLIVAAKLLTRTRIVYVESLARVHRLSLSGKLIYRLRLADMFLVQWPELAQNYPGTVYTGLLV